MSTLSLALQSQSQSQPQPQSQSSLGLGLGLGLCLCFCVGSGLQQRLSLLARQSWAEVEASRKSPDACQVRTGQVRSDQISLCRAGIVCYAGVYARACLDVCAKDVHAHACMVCEKKLSIGKV
jgi:hypothetical protein